MGKEKIIIGSIGPLDEHKGHETIIEVIRKSKLLQRKVIFIIVGSGNNERVKSLMSFIHKFKLNKNIILTGFMKEKSKDIVAGFDIFVMPTIDFEGFGYSMAEVMLAGVPPVVSNVGALKEVIISDQSGIIIEPSTNILKWKKRLESLVEDRNLRNWIGATAKKRIKDNFQSSKMSLEYYDFMVNKNGK